MKFIPGLTLNEGFFDEVVHPLLMKNYPHLKFSSALIGYGSDVLGLDTPISMDHNWGPRLLLFLNESDYNNYADDIKRFFQYNLPFEYKGFPTNFTDPSYDSTQRMEKITKYPINHLIEVTTPTDYLKQYLGLNSIEKITWKEWISFADQNLIELTTGEVFNDDIGFLNKMREKLKFYPNNIRLLRLSSLWKSIGNEEPFIGRCIETQDFIGLKIISARIVNYLMKICFYLEKRYIPYSKWFGSAFKKLSSYHELEPIINKVLMENGPIKIEEHLCKAYEYIVQLHNTQDGFPILENKVQHFFSRPYRVIFAETIIGKLQDAISIEELRGVNIDKIAIDIKLDSIDFTENNLLKEFFT